MSTVKIIKFEKHPTDESAVIIHFVGRSLPSGSTQKTVHDKTYRDALEKAGKLT